MVLKIVGLHYTSTAPITSDLDIKMPKKRKVHKIQPACPAGLAYTADLSSSQPQLNIIYVSNWKTPYKFKLLQPLYSCCKPLCNPSPVQVAVSRLFLL